MITKSGVKYCPFCAVERWPVVAALSRFGAFGDLGQTVSSPSDIYPNTALVSFYGAQFSSDVVSLTRAGAAEQPGEQRAARRAGCAGCGRREPV